MNKMTTSRMGSDEGFIGPFLRVGPRPRVRGVGAVFQWARTWSSVFLGGLILFGACDVLAQEKPKPPEPGELSVATKEPLYLRDRLQIKATGLLAKSILAEMEKPAADRKLTLFLSGVELNDLPATYTVDGVDANEVMLQFTLLRDPTKDASRAAWDRLLDDTAPQSLLYTVDVALAVGGGHPLHLKNRIQIGVAGCTYIRVMMFLCLSAFLALLIVLGMKSNMLKEGGDTGPYSLGRTQMAFWGLLVLFCWVGTSFITGCMEHVPKETLILLGISATTGLGSLAIGDNKEVKRQAHAALEQEKATLLAQKAAVVAPAVFPQASEERLAQINQELALTLRASGRQAAGVPRMAMSRFFNDLCSDENGLSFHRLQVVLWTIALGSFFAWRVASTLSMPVFPETLLILMGISNGTYIGFKISERQ